MGITVISIASKVITKERIEKAANATSNAAKTTKNAIASIPDKIRKNEYK